MKFYMMITLLIILAVIIIPITSPLFSNGCDDIFCNIIIEAVIPIYLIDIFNGFDGVSAEYIKGNEVSNWTELNVNVSDLSIPKELIISYTEKIERQELNNQAQTLLYPDGLPAPMCIRDLVTGKNHGIYAVNGQLFMNQNDTRCESP